MKILQIHASDQGGGAESVVLAHHEQLRRQGHDAAVVVGRKLGSDPTVTALPAAKGMPGVARVAHWLERHKGLQYGYAPGFRHFVRRLDESWDVIHLHSLHGAAGYADIGILPWLSRRFPLVISLHDMWLMTGHCGHGIDCPRWQTGCGRCPDLALYPGIPKDGTRLNWWRKWLVFRRCATHLITPSQWLKQRVEESPILRHVPVTAIPNPIDLSLFCPGSQQSARHRLGLAVEGLVVMLVAQFLSSAFKGVEQGMAALDSLMDTPLTVLAVGRSGPYQEPRGRHPVHHVPFTADRELIVQYYRAADLVLVPSRAETFGLVAAEAMACGTPVVAYDSGGLPEVVGCDEGGIVVQRDDVTALAAATKAVINDSDLRTKLSRQAAARAARLFDVRKHTHDCLEIYRQISRKADAS